MSDYDPSMFTVRVVHVIGCAGYSNRMVCKYCCPHDPQAVRTWSDKDTSLATLGESAREHWARWHREEGT